MKGCVSLELTDGESSPSFRGLGRSPSPSQLNDVSVALGEKRVLLKKYMSNVAFVGDADPRDPRSSLSGSRLPLDYPAEGSARYDLDRSTLNPSQTTRLCRRFRTIACGCSESLFNFNNIPFDSLNLSNEEQFSSHCWNWSPEDNRVNALHYKAEDDVDSCQLRFRPSSSVDDEEDEVAQEYRHGILPHYTDEQPLDLTTRKHSSPYRTNTLEDDEGVSESGSPYGLPDEEPDEEFAWLKKIKTGTRSRVRSPKSWEFLLRLLLDNRSNPRMIRWEEEQSGTFRLVRKDEIAKIWGNRSSKHKDGGLTYDNFARNLRYHYKTKMLVPVSEKHLVYRFGEEVMEKLRNGTIIGTNS